MKESHMHTYSCIRNALLDKPQFLSRNQKIVRKSIEMAVFAFAFFILKYTHFFSDDIFISLFINIGLFLLILIIFYGILQYYRNRFRNRIDKNESNENVVGGTSSKDDDSSGDNSHVSNRS
jgi:cation transport ATPase